MEKMGVLLVLFVATMALANGQELCLSEPMVELSVHAVLVRAPRANLCQNETFKDLLRERIMSNYRPPADSDCRIEGLREVSCSTLNRRGSRRRVTLLLRTNLTCGSNGCTRHSATRIKDSFQQSREMENDLRTAMRATRKVTLRHRNSRLRIVYFSGRKGTPFDVCRDTRVSSIRDKLNLCSCPSDCPPPRNTMECSNGMTYSDCGSACPATCKDPSPFCIFQCKEGCFCPSGMVEHEGSCITRDMCPTEERRCPAGMTFNPCGTACPATCEEPSPFCTFICTQGCCCPPGMLQHDGGCITRDKCPTATEKPPTERDRECPAGMTYSSCGSACPATCDDPTPFCLARCTEGCFCPAGMVEHNGTCITSQMCPTEPTRPQCPAGMTYNECGSACAPTCKDRAPAFCTLQCKQGCFCPAGLVEHDETCIRPEECPTDTDSDESPTDKDTDTDIDVVARKRRALDGSHDRKLRRKGKGGEEDGSGGAVVKSGDEDDVEARSEEEKPCRRLRKKGRKASEENGSGGDETDQEDEVSSDEMEEEECERRKGRKGKEGKGEGLNEEGDDPDSDEEDVAVGNEEEPTEGSEDEESTEEPEEEESTETKEHEESEDEEPTEISEYEDYTGKDYSGDYDDYMREDSTGDEDTGDFYYDESKSGETGADEMPVDEDE